MRIFVSFSGRDQQVVRRLLLDMARHHVDVWDYSRDDDRLPAAVPLRDGLADQLRRVDTVVVIVSRASAAPDSPYTQCEVEQALALGLRIVPVRLIDAPPGPLSPAFAELERRELRYVTLASNGAGYERGMSDLLSALGVRYRPQVVAHQRLPLFERFEAELSALHAEASNAFFTDMGILAQGFGERYSVSDWAGAYKLIGRFCDRLLDRWPAVDFYYPWIVKGVCELHLEQFVNAEKTFDSLTSHPLCDENAHAGRGHACFGQGKLRRALRDYENASADARRAQRSDAEIEINRVTTLVELGEPVPEAILSPNLETVLPQDLGKVKLLRGVALFKLGRLRDARQQLAEILEPPELYSVAVSHLADVLGALGLSGEALRAVTACLRAISSDSALWLPLHHRLAAIYTEGGDFEEALAIYREHLCVEGGWTRQYMTEYARLLGALGHRAEADRVCRLVTSTSPFGVPATPHDYYYYGFALYLLGRADAADASFELAGTGYPAYAGL